MSQLCAVCGIRPKCSKRRECSLCLKVRRDAEKEAAPGPIERPAPTDDLFYDDLMLVLYNLETGTLPLSQKGRREYE